MEKEIEPKLQTIGDYLKKSEIFRIPEYQRAYSWNITNCDKLLQDVKSYIDQRAEDPYFFGTIIIDCSKKGFLNLIDGQQRTTTFLLFLKAMHIRIVEVLANMPDTEEALGLKRSLVQSLDTIYEILYRADVRKQIEIVKDWENAKGIKIIENESINELHKEELKNIIEARDIVEAEKAVYKFPRKQKDNKYTNFFRNFKFFYEKLKDYNESNLDFLVNEFLNKCQIIQIKSWQIEQAITMFNSLNSTGLPLSDADIISAHLFSHAEDQSEFKSIWEPIIQLSDKLEQKKIVNIDSVLQQFMYINRARKRQYVEGELNTPGVRKYYTVVCPELLDNPSDLCADFSKILNIWNKIQDYPVVKLMLKFNENFKLFLMPYLFSRTSDDDITEQNITPIVECFLRLFTLLEVSAVGFSSRNFKTFLFNENFNLVDSAETIDSIVNHFDCHIIKNWNQQNVIDDLKAYEKNILVYLNEYLYAKKKNLMFDFRPDKVNIEHIMPASGRNIDSIREDALMSQEEFEDNVNLLGNKILLEEDINKRIGRDWFKTKKGGQVKDKKGYLGSKFALALSLSRYSSDNWTKNDIENANQKAAERICNFIFNNPL
ncbi:MAG: DUF262 domain-containing HNH endonuclease family protein [Bacteroides sp.]|nr:DUF262 domain-containing HNH endonuclease family protein [Bacteroides sp.]